MGLLKELERRYVHAKSQVCAHLSAADVVPVLRLRRRVELVFPADYHTIVCG